jgi:ParB family chromosome partitioning protein
MSEEEVMEVALIENLQREDLSPLEEAEGYQSLMKTYGMTQDDVAKTVGKSRPAVTNALRLLSLPPEVKELVESGTISAGHARTLLSFPDERSMEEGLSAAKAGASVRELEKMTQKASDEKHKKTQPRKIRYYEEAELALKEHLGRKVSISGTKKRGMLQIEFYGQGDLADIMKHFSD